MALKRWINSGSIGLSRVTNYDYMDSAGSEGVCHWIPVIGGKSRWLLLSCSTPELLVGKWVKKGGRLGRALDWYNRDDLYVRETACRTAACCFKYESTVINWRSIQQARRERVPHLSQRWASSPWGTTWSVSADGCLKPSFLTFEPRITIHRSLLRSKIP